MDLFFLFISAILFGVLIGLFIGKSVALKVIRKYFKQ